MADNAKELQMLSATNILKACLNWIEYPVL